MLYTIKNLSKILREAIFQPRDKKEKILEKERKIKMNIILFEMNVFAFFSSK